MNTSSDSDTAALDNPSTALTVLTDQGGELEKGFFEARESDDDFKIVSEWAAGDTDSQDAATTLEPNRTV